MHKFKGLLIVLVLATLPALSLARSLQEPTLPKYVPEETSVVLLPTVDLTGEKWAKLVFDRKARVDNTLRDLFTKRGFSVAEPSKVEAAMAHRAFDTSDEDNLTNDAVHTYLLDVGRSLDSRLVVFATIVNSDQHATSTKFFGGAEGNVTMKVWVLDTVKNEDKGFILKVKITKKESGSMYDKGSTMKVKAAGTGVKEALMPLLVNHPERGK